MNWILPLFKLDFWFNLTAIPFMPWLDKALPIVMLAALVIGIAMLAYGAKARGLDKDRRQLISSLGAVGFWAGISGLLLYFFVWESIPVLSMRVFWIVWLVGFGYWKWTIYRRYFRLLPAEKAKQKEREAYEKWLPKPKK
jgi:hypothetical protein